MGKGGRAGGGGDWSSYYYNGYIYGSEMGRGTDVLKLVPSKYLTQNEIDAAAQVHLAEFNVQDQPYIDYPKTTSPPRLTSINWFATTPSRSKKARRSIAAMDGKKTKEMKAFAASLDKDAATAAPGEADRMKALSEILKK